VVNRCRDRGFGAQVLTQSQRIGTGESLRQSGRAIPLRIT
jgi:hypothetical protein